MRTIATELTLGGEKQFNDAMKGVNSNLKTMRSDMAAVSSEFRKNETSVEALRAKQKILQDQYKQQQEVVRALTERLKAVKETYGEDSAEADKYRQKLNAATVAMNKAKDAAEANREALSKHGPVIGRVSDEYTKLKGKFEDVKKSVDAAIKQVPVLGDAYEIAGKSIANVADGATESFSNIAKAAATVAGVGAAAAGAVAAIGVSALDTLTGFATDAATRSKDAYDQAQDYFDKATKAMNDGNEELMMEYLQKADELMAGIDQDYLQLGFSLENLQTVSTSAKDALGKVLLPAIQGLSEEGAALLQSFAEDMEDAAGDTEQMGQIMADYLQAGIALLREKVPEFGQIALDLIEGLGAGFQENLPSMLEDVLSILDYILSVLSANAGRLGGAAAQMVTMLASFLIDSAPELLDGGIALITQIINGLAREMPNLLSKMPALVQTLLQSLVKNAPNLLLAGVEFIEQILDGLAQALPDILAEVIALPGKLFDAIIHADVDWGSIGKNIVTGIWNGVVGVWNGFVADVQGLFDNLFGSTKSHEEIFSPSRKWARGVGSPLARGVGVGFADAMPDVARDMQRSLDEAAPSAGAFNQSWTSSESASGGGSVSRVNNWGGVSIIVNGYNVQDDDQLAEILSYKLQELVDRKES